MKNQVVRFLWIGKTDLSALAQDSLISKFEGQYDLKIYKHHLALPVNSAEATRAIIEAAERFKVSVIGGDFQPNVAAALVKSQTYGGRFNKYVIAIPIPGDAWEIFL